MLLPHLHAALWCETGVGIPVTMVRRVSPPSNERWCVWGGNVVLLNGDRNLARRTQAGFQHLAVAGSAAGSRLGAGLVRRAVDAVGGFVDDLVTASLSTIPALFNSAATHPLVPAIH